MLSGLLKVLLLFHVLYSTCVNFPSPRNDCAASQTQKPFQDLVRRLPHSTFLDLTTQTDALDDAWEMETTGWDPRSTRHPSSSSSFWPYPSDATSRLGPDFMPPSRPMRTDDVLSVQEPETTHVSVAHPSASETIPSDVPVASNRKIQFKRPPNPLDRVNLRNVPEGDDDDHFFPLIIIIWRRCQHLLFIEVLHSGASDTCRQQWTFVSALLCDAPLAAAPSGSQHEGCCLQPTDGFVLLENGCSSHRIETRCCELDFQEQRRELRWTHRFISCTNSMEHGVFHGDFDVVLTSQTEVLVCRCSSRLVGTDKDICNGYTCPPLLVERTMWCRGGKKTVSDTSFSLFSTCLPSHLEGVKQHLGGKRWMLCTIGLMGYSCLFQHVACRY